MLEVRQLEEQILWERDQYYAQLAQWERTAAEASLLRLQITALYLNVGNAEC